MIYTSSGWSRATKEEKEEQGRVANRRPVKFRCRCFRCWDCKNLSVSLVQKHHFYVNEYGNADYTITFIPVCHKCGRPHQRHDGSYFDLKHTKMCKNNWKDISDVGIKNSDLALLVHLMGELLKHFENKDLEGKSIG